MAKDRSFTIEQLGADLRWFVLGSRDNSGDAQRDMAGYRKLFPKVSLRVVGNPSRGHVVISCPDLPVTAEAR